MLPHVRGLTLVLAHDSHQSARLEQAEMEPLMKGKKIKCLNCGHKLLTINDSTMVVHGDTKVLLVADDKGGMKSIECPKCKTENRIDRHLLDGF